METAINLVLSTDLNMLSIGATGAADGTGFKPLYAGDFDFLINHNPCNTAASGISVARLTLSSANNYYAVPFILNQTTTVNRLAVSFSTTSAPNITIRGGVMQYDTTTGYPTQNSSTAVITFVAGANTTLTDTGTAVNFVTGQYTIFAFTSNVTLSANTWYAAGFSITAYTSGNVTANLYTGNSSLGNKRFPGNLRRFGANVQAQNDGRGGVLLGFFNGTSFNYPIGEYLPAGGSNINISPTLTTQTQVGAKFEINLPQDEIYLNKIHLGQSSISSSASVVCKIYNNITATTAIATSIVMSTSYCFTNGTIRHRFYYFSPPVRLKGFRSYYAMWEVTNGFATTVLPTGINRMGSGITTSYQYQYTDSLNQVYFRNNVADANLSSSAGYYLPINLFLDYFKKTPSPRIS